MLRDRKYRSVVHSLSWKYRGEWWLTLCVLVLTPWQHPCFAQSGGEEIPPAIAKEPPTAAQEVHPTEPIPPLSALAEAAPSPPASAQALVPPNKRKPAEPFTFADFSWLNGNSRTTESPLECKVFTGVFRADTSCIYDFYHFRR